MSEDLEWHQQVVLPALLRHGRTVYGQAMRHALAEAGYDDIPGNGLYVIGALALADVPMQLIVAELGVSKQAASQLIDALVLRGYLERAPHPDDRRRLTITLTERGRAAAAVQAEARDFIDGALLDAVGPEAVATTRRVLGTLIGIGKPFARRTG